MVILFWLFVIFIVVGGLFFIITAISGVATVIKAKIKGVSLQEQQRADTSARVWKLMEDKSAKERRRGYAPNIEVEVKVIHVAAKDETPEEKAAREKAEARKRYLESLVDR
jgi:hypothetical protein